jgi:hypothetical protein
MIISSLSSATLVLIPDSSPRAYGGVGYSFMGFFVWKDSGMSARLLWLMGLF